jgi:hypothetical protein
MPYYRIIIWTQTQKKPICGIRQYDHYNIDAVFLMVKKKAESIYRQNLIDIDVQMISKLSTDVKKFLSDAEKKRENKKWAVPNDYMQVVQSRRSQNPEPTKPWIERSNGS